MGNRAAAEAVILNGLSEVDPSKVNTKLMESFLKAMDDKAFEAYYKAIKEGNDFIPIVMENLNGIRITTQNNLRVAKAWGVEFFQRVWTTDPTTGTLYLTPKKYPVMHLPIRRQIQTLENKSSIPEDNKHIDEMTDQPTGVSKGSSMSFPESLVMYSQGYEKCILEFIKFRGGDLKLMTEMEKQIRDTGGVSMDSLSAMSKTRVRSTLTLSTLLKGAHLDNNF